MGTLSGKLLPHHNKEETEAASSLNEVFHLFFSGNTVISITDMTW